MDQINSNCPYKEENCVKENCNCAKFLAYEKAKNPNEIKNKLISLGFDYRTPSWELLMNMQKTFASKFHKVDNLTKEEKEHWIDKYLVCIDDEIREAREHLVIYDDFGNSKFNQEELNKEIIDILHFVMDTFICGGATFETVEKYYLNKYVPVVKEVTDLVEFSHLFQKDILSSEVTNVLNFDHRVLLLLCKLSDACGKVRQQISWKHWKKPSSEININRLFNAYAEMFKCLMDLFIILNVTPQEIKDIYVKKNIENIFRQDFGYLK